MKSHFSHVLIASLLACAVVSALKANAVPLPSAYRFATNPESTGWKSVGPEGSSAYRFPTASAPQGWRSIGPSPSAARAMGAEAVAGRPANGDLLSAGGAPSISIHLESSTISYSNVMPGQVAPAAPGAQAPSQAMGSGGISRDIRCDLTANGPIAFFLDDNMGQVDLTKLPWTTKADGTPLDYENAGSQFIPMDWAVKSITGSEYRDFTPGRYATMAEGMGVQGLYWVFDRSLPGTVVFTLRNTIYPEGFIPPGRYEQAYHVATGPVL